MGVSLVAVAILMGLLNKGVPLEDRPQLFNVLANSMKGFIALYFLCSVAQGIFRAFRYRLLITADNVEQAPSIWHLYLVTLVRNMTVDMLPARLGELSYVAMLNRGYNVSTQTCVSSLAFSFVFDLVALLLVMVGLLVYQLLHGTLGYWIFVTVILLTILIGLITLILYKGVSWTTHLLDRVPNFFNRPNTKAYWMLKFMHRLSDTIDNTRQAGVFSKTLMHSLLIRFFKYMGLFFLFKAVVVPNFTEFSQMPSINIIIALISAEGSASIPLPAFMSFGTYEAGGVLALVLLGFAKLQSMLTMLGIHILSQCIDYSLGMIGVIIFIFTTVKFGSNTLGRRLHRNRIFNVMVAALVLLGGIVWVAWQY